MEKGVKLRLKNCWARIWAGKAASDPAWMRSSRPCQPGPWGSNGRLPWRLEQVSTHFRDPRRKDSVTTG